MTNWLGFVVCIYHLVVSVDVSRADLKGNLLVCENVNLNQESFGDRCWHPEDCTSMSVTHVEIFPNDYLGLFLVLLSDATDIGACPLRVGGILWPEF